jgi:flagellar basal body L-ring protein FlgH
MNHSSKTKPQVFFVVIVIILLSLSGCISANGSNPSQTGSESTSRVNETHSMDGSPTNSPIDHDSILDKHRTSLKNTNYTKTEYIRSTSGVIRKSTYLVDNANEELFAHERVVGNNSSVEFYIYYSNGTLYNHRVVDGESQTKKRSVRWDTTTHQFPRLKPTMFLFGYDFSKVTKHSGGPQEHIQYDGKIVNNSTHLSKSTVIVSHNGTIREARLNNTNNLTSTSIQDAKITFSNVGTTEVNRPEWSLSAED